MTGIHEGEREKEKVKERGKEEKSILHTHNSCTQYVRKAFYFYSYSSIVKYWKPRLFDRKEKWYNWKQTGLRRKRKDETGDKWRREGGDPV